MRPAWFEVSEHSCSAAQEIAATLQHTQEHTHAHTSSLPIVCLRFYDFLFVFYCSTAAQKDLESEHELNATKKQQNIKYWTFQHV